MGVRNDINEEGYNWPVGNYRRTPPKIKGLNTVPVRLLGHEIETKCIGRVGSPIVLFLSDHQSMKVGG